MTSYVALFLVTALHCLILSQQVTIRLSDWTNGDSPLHVTGPSEAGQQGRPEPPHFSCQFFFRRRLNFRVPRHHAPLARSVRVGHSPRHYELAVCLISACMEFSIRNVSA